MKGFWDRFYWNCVDQFDGHCGIMCIGAGVQNDERCAVAVGDQVAFRAVFTCIFSIIGCRVWAGLCPQTARVEQLSIAVIVHSIPSRRPSSSRNDFQIFSQIPAACQSRSRRQHVIPLPQFISCDKYSHGVPVLRINRMPVKQSRSETRGRPPFGLGFSGGSCGLIRSHNSSSSKRLAMMMPSLAKRLASLSAKQHKQH